MSGVYNFCAGPAMLPVDVMVKAQQEFINWNDMGSSVMELSHRSPEYMAVAAKAEATLRQLMDIPTNYKVLFCHGGGRGQFSAVPLNLLPQGKKADYIVSGSWSKSAVTEALKFGEVNVIDISVETENTKTILPLNEWPLSPDAAYVHYCPNETVDGLEIFELPETNGVPLVADLSSTILSRKFDVSKFGLIYAGAQKNIGPSGLAIVIVRDDLIGKAAKATPCIMDYKSLADNDSMFNTPPTYAWYLAGLVFDWLTELGGVDVIEKINTKKAELLYSYIDDTDFYQNKIPKEYRSKMNVPFYLANEELNTKFLTESSHAGLKALKGHRMVGGMRASIYNAMPYEGVVALVDFMKKFEQENR